MAVKTFATGEVLTASDTNTYLNNGGLVYITSTTVGSAVSSVTIQNAFSTTYDAYRIVLANVDGSTSAAALIIQLVDSGGTPATTNYSFAGFYMTYTSTTVNGQNGTEWLTSLSNTNCGSAFEIYNPFLSVASYFDNSTVDDVYFRSYGGKHTTASSYTGIKLATNTGTMTGGTITVYGYRKA